MSEQKNQIMTELDQLRTELDSAKSVYQEVKDELESFLAQFTCVLDAPSCGCSEEELNDPKFDALYTEQDRLTKLSKTYSRQIADLKAKISALESQLAILS